MTYIRAGETNKAAKLALFSPEFVIFREKIVSAPDNLVNPPAKYIGADKKFPVAPGKQHHFPARVPRAVSACGVL